MRKLSKGALIVIMVGLLCQTGFVVYAAVQTNSTGGSVPSEASQYSPADEIKVSKEVLDAIRTSDPDNYERNITNYMNMLVSLNVHKTMRQEIERLAVEGNSLPDILIGYEFLYQQFGLISELDSLVSEVRGGKNWANIFTAYNDSHEIFVPRSFDSGYLEKLMNTPSLNSNDIMIADRISFVSDTSFADLIDAKIETTHWQQIAADAGVVFSADTLPVVRITADQLSAYAGQGGLTEDRVINAFVTATKLGMDAETVIDLVKVGNSEEDIYANHYMTKYRP